MINVSNHETRVKESQICFSFAFMANSRREVRSREVAGLTLCRFRVIVMSKKDKQVLQDP